MTKLLSSLGAKRKITAVALDQIALSATGVVINILLIRSLNVDDFGIYVIVFSFLMLTNSVHNALITAPISVIVTKLNDKEAASYISKLNMGQALLNLMLTVIVVLSAFLVGFYEQYEIYEAALYVVGVTSFFYLGQLYIRSILLARLRTKDVLKNDVLHCLIQIIIIQSLISIDFINIVTAIMALGISALIAFAYGAFQCKEFVAFQRTSVWEGARQNVSHGKWLLGTALIAWGRTNILNFISLYLIGPAAPAVLRATQTIFGPAGLVLGSLESMVPQFCSKVYGSKGIKGLNQLLNKVLFALFSGILFYALVAGLFAFEILDLLFGSEYVEYELVIWIMCVQHIFIVWQTVNSIALRVIDRPSLMFSSFIVEAIVTIVPGVLLVKVYGIEGAAAWKLLSSIVVSLLTYRFFIKTSRLLEKKNGVF